MHTSTIMALLPVVCSLLLLLASAASPANGACVVSETKGCYADENDHRLLKFVAKGTYASPGLVKTQELCAEYCCHQGHTAVAGMEAGGQCFCDDSFNPPAG